MSLTLDSIKERYQFHIEKVLQGNDVIKENKCSQWTRNKELRSEKDLFYVHIHLKYASEEEQSVVFKQFYLEDSEGYLCDPLPPDDYFESTLKKGQSTKGGILFSMYQDTKASRLWFDTNIYYDNSSDPIFIDIALPTKDSETRTEILSKEALLMKHYTQQIETGLGKENITPEDQTKTLMKKLSQKFGIPYKKIDNGYLLRVPLAESRKQNIIVTFSGKDKKGNDLVTIATICAPEVTNLQYRVFLKLNPKLTYGSIGITSINNEDFYVITQTYPISILKSKGVIIDAIEYIALQGDWLEKKLVGKDIR